VSVREREREREREGACEEDKNCGGSRDRHSSFSLINRARCWHAWVIFN